MRSLLSRATSYLVLEPHVCARNSRTQGRPPVSQSHAKVVHEPGRQARVGLSPTADWGLSGDSQLCPFPR